MNIPAIFTKLSTKVDRSIKLEFETRELPGETLADFLNMRGDEGWITFTPNRQEKIKVPEEPADSGTDQKTPSQRFRGRLFVYFTEHLGKDKKDFQPWYVSELERLGEKYLERVEQ